MILFLATRAGGRRTCGMIMTYDLFCFRGGDARYAAYLKSRSNGAVAHWVKVQEWTAREKEEAQALKHILFSTGPIPPPEGEQHRDGRRKRTNTDQAAWVGRRKRTDTNQDARAKPEAVNAAGEAQALKHPAAFVPPGTRGPALKHRNIRRCVRQRRLLQPWLDH